MRSEFALLKEELKRLEHVNGVLHEDINRERENVRAAKELAGAGGDREDVISELRRVVGDLEGQLKQQVGGMREMCVCVGVFVCVCVCSVCCGFLTPRARKLKY